MQLDHSVRAMIGNIKVAGAIEREPHRLDQLHVLRRSPFSRDAADNGFAVSSVGFSLRLRANTALPCVTWLDRASVPCTSL